MADAPKLLGTDTLRIAYPKVNMAIDNANAALRNSNNAVATAGQAVETANQALQNSESTQTQLDNIIIENGQSDAEVVQARTKADGTTFPVLRDRLNDVDDKIGILNKKNENIISVKEFGAKGDGVTDDTVAIQNAAQAVRGGRLYFPEGAYVVSEPIQMSDTSSTEKYRPVTKVFGAGVGKSIIINNVQGGDKACLEWNQTVEQAQNYRFGVGAFIEDIEIKGGTNCTSNGIKAEGLFFLSILRTKIHQNGANGIYMPYNENLEASMGQGAGDDAYLTGYVHINQSFIQSNGKYDKSGCGIYADKLSATFTIENSHITDNYGWGARLSTRELIINRNSFSNNGQGDGITRYGGLRIQRASSVVSGALPHSNRFGQNEFDGNWGVDVDLYSCGYSELEGIMIIPRVIDKTVIPNTYRSQIGIRIGGGGSSEGVYNDIIKPVFRIADFNNGGNAANDPTYTCIKIESGSYGNRIIEPFIYSGGSSKVTKIVDNGFNNEWIEGGLIKHKSGITNVKPYVIARQPNPTTIPHNIITKLTWASKQSDKYNMFDATNGTLTMPFGGVVSVKGFITLLNTVAGNDVSLFVYYNGSSYKRLFFRTIGGSYETIQFDFGLMEFPTAGTIDVRIYQSSGTDINLDGTNGQWSNLEIKID